MDGNFLDPDSLSRAYGAEVFLKEIDLEITSS